MESHIVQEADLQAFIVSILKKVAGACYDARVEEVSVFNPEYLDFEITVLKTGGENAIANTSTQFQPEHDVISVQEHGDTTTEETQDGYDSVRTTENGSQTTSTADGGEDIADTYYEFTFKPLSGP